MYACMSVHMYVAQEHLVKTPTVPTSPSQSVNPSCNTAKPTTLNQTWLSSILRSNVLVPPEDPDETTLQLPVTQQRPPGVTKLNVLLSVLQLSVASLAPSILRPFSLRMNSTVKSLHDSPFRLQYHFCGGGNRLTQPTSASSFCTKPIFRSSLPRVALARRCGRVFLSPSRPLSCSSSLIYCELIFASVADVKGFLFCLPFCKDWPFFLFFFF